MKVAFDTSVLVAALLSAHRDHAHAIVWLDAVAGGNLVGVASVHALNEVWSVLTKVPVSPPISPRMAYEAIRNIAVCIEIAPLTREICTNAIDRCATKGLRSGAIFDALHLLTAEAVTADSFLTFNEKDFVRLTTETSPPIIVPSSKVPPSI